MAERNRREQRRARERMAETGENYTTALRAIRAEKRDDFPYDDFVQNGIEVLQPDDPQLREVLSREAEDAEARANAEERGEVPPMPGQRAKEADRD